MTLPYPFQLKGVRQLHRFGGRGLLADEQGLGKTLQALLYAIRHPDLKPVVVVCPASVKFVWEREAAKHFNLRCEVLSGTRGAGPSPLVVNTPPLVVVNYDILGKRKGMKTGGGWLPYLKFLKPQLVVLDECQALADPRSLRTRWVYDLCEGVPQILALSGTPLTNRPVELWPVLHLLRPDLFPSGFSFRLRYCGAKRTPWGWDYKGSSNLQELHSILINNLMVRRKKADVLKELPSITRSVIPLELSNEGEYHKAVKDFRSWLRERKPEAWSRAERAESLVKVGYILRLAGELKLPNTIKWVDGFLKGCDRKIVVFAVHKPIVAALRAHYTRQCVVVDGSTSLKRRRQAVDTFQNNPKARVFIGNIDAAGKGLTLTAASDVAFAELDWTPGAHLQAEARVNRIGSVNTAFIHYLVAKGTVETSLVELLQSKQGVLSATLDGGSTGSDLDIHDRLIELLKGEE